MPELHLSNMTKQYPANKGKSDPAFSLSSVDLTIREGEFVCLLGPSGCGKTTLLKLVAGLLVPDQGDIRLGAKSITHLPAEQRSFGMVFQEALLFPHMTIENNVAFGLKMLGVGRRERQERAARMLETVGLAGYESRYPAELSGGQRQRVSLARAIVSKPTLLLMDEPFSALDPGLREEMRELVKQLHREFSETILFVTHDREEAFQLADRVAVMNIGQIVQTAAPRDLYENPESLEVALFMSSSNLIEGKIKEGKFCADGFEIRLGQQDRPHGWFMVRPESCFILTDNAEEMKEDDGYRRRVAGTVREISYRQGLSHIRLQIGSESFAVLEKTSAFPSLQTGDTVTIGFDIRETRLITQRGGV